MYLNHQGWSNNKEKLSKTSFLPSVEHISDLFKTKNQNLKNKLKSWLIATQMAAHKVINKCPCSGKCPLPFKEILPMCPSPANYANIIHFILQLSSPFRLWSLLLCQFFCTLWYIWRNEWIIFIIYWISTCNTLYLWTYILYVYTIIYFVFFIIRYLYYMTYQY